MRPIKFRAWLKLSEEMYQVRKLDFKKQKVFIFSDNFDLRVRFMDIELMQFTGFYDKIDEEIFEGDIVYYNIYNENFVCVWEEDISSFAFVKIIDGDNSKYYHFNNKVCKNNILIVGNIYDNPELLEK